MSSCAPSEWRVGPASADTRTRQETTPGFRHPVRGKRRNPHNQAVRVRPTFNAPYAGYVERALRGFRREEPSLEGQTAAQRGKSVAILRVLLSARSCHAGARAPWSRRDHAGKPNGRPEGRVYENLAFARFCSGGEQISLSDGSTTSQDRRERPVQSTMQENLSAELERVTQPPAPER